MYRRSVFYYETDRMGIVHNSNYLRYFEEARLDLMRTIGADYHRMETEGIMIPQTEAYVKYRAPIAYGDTISVDVKLAEFNGIIMKFEYNIAINDGAEIVTSGYTCHCFVDDATRRPVNIKKRSPRDYEALRAAIG